MHMWFGKIPAVGDFCASDMPAAVEAELDQWISTCMQRCELLFNQQWLTLYFAAPMSAFYWPPGVCKSLGNAHAVGVLMPSVDKAGRAYPLIVLQTLHSQPDTCCESLHFEDWLKHMHRICSQTLDEDWPPEVLNRALSELPALHQQTLQLDLQTSAPPKPLWFSLQLDGIEPHQLDCEGLPDAVQFCRLYGYTE